MIILVPVICVKQICLTCLSDKSVKCIKRIEIKKFYYKFPRVHVRYFLVILFIHAVT